MSSAILASKRVILQITSVPKSQKTSGGLDDLHVND